MEYCGAGSVSDIIRLRNKTVRTLSSECYKWEAGVVAQEAEQHIQCFWCNSHEVFSV